MAADKDYFGRLNRPTVAQIQYVEVLAQLIGNVKKRGIVTMVASRCQVNHASVSRFFRSCIKAGYIDESYHLTQDGEVWLDHYLRLRDAVYSHLEDLNIPHKDIKRNIRGMMENMDDHVLTAMVEQMKGERRQTTSLEPYAKSRGQVDMTAFLANGEYQVGFRMLTLNRNNQFGHDTSMSDRGFEKPGRLVKNDSEAYLELTLRELRAHSKMTGQEMKGRLSTIKYECGGGIFPLEIIDNKVRIPIKGCTYDRRANGNATGLISVILSGNVGPMHMLESTALLLFWV